jgi:hypothetical protein
VLLVSLLHIAPKGDRFAALWLGLSGRRQDYTKTGWRLVQSGQVLCVGGLALLLTAMWVLGER